MAAPTVAGLRYRALPRRHPPITMNLALFDFDGTITTRELFGDFVRAAVPRRRLAYGRVLLTPLVLGYKAGVVSGSIARAAVVRIGFTGVSHADYVAHGQRFARDVVPGLLRPDAMARIAWHRARGDDVVVVSGAFDVYLRPWCEAHGLGVICSGLAHRGGVLTGRYDGAQCVRATKARRVREAYDVASYARIYAYGDTVEDRDLLALADERWYRGERVAA